MKDDAEYLISAYTNGHMAVCINNEAVRASLIRIGFVEPVKGFNKKYVVLTKAGQKRAKQIYDEYKKIKSGRSYKRYVHETIDYHRNIAINKNDKIAGPARVSDYYSYNPTKYCY